MALLNAGGMPTNYYNPYPSTTHPASTYTGGGGLLGGTYQPVGGPPPPAPAPQPIAPQPPPAAMAPPPPPVLAPPPAAAPYAQDPRIAALMAQMQAMANKPAVPVPANPYIAQLATLSQHAPDPYANLSPQAQANLAAQTHAAQSAADLARSDSQSQLVADLYGRGVNQSTIANGDVGRFTYGQGQIEAGIMGDAAARDNALRLAIGQGNLQGYGMQGNFLGNAAGQQGNQNALTVQAGQQDTAQRAGMLSSLLGSATGQQDSQNQYALGSRGQDLSYQSSQNSLGAGNYGAYLQYLLGSSGQTQQGDQFAQEMELRRKQQEAQLQQQQYEQQLQQQQLQQQQAAMQLPPVSGPYRPGGGGPSGGGVLGGWGGSMSGSYGPGALGTIAPEYLSNLNNESWLYPYIKTVVPG